MRRTSRPWLSMLLVPLFLALGALPSLAQNAQVTGTVKDDSGAVVPGVTVTARNQETGLVRTTVSDETGAYRVTALPPGSYTVTAEIQGFATETRRDLVLIIGQTAPVNFAMKPAAVAETVTVTGAAPIVDTTRSDVTTSVSSQQIQDLPLANTRWIAFAMLTPGVSQDNIRSQYYAGTVDVGAGGREYSNGYIVDGANNTWQEMGEPRQDFAMDSIREFKVTASNFKAEYGLATGGVVEVVSKSGTNRLQGSGMLFYRNESLTAVQAFQAVKPPYSRYQWGGTLGGPIVKDKTHYFLAYERTDEEQNFTTSTRGIWPQYDGTYASNQKRWNYTVKVDQQFNQSQSAFLRFAQEDEYRPIVNAGGRTAPSGAFDFGVPRHSAVAGHTWVISDRALNDFRFQQAFSQYEISPPYTPNNLQVGVFTAPPDNCTDRYTYPSVTVGGCQMSLGPETRWQFKEDFSYLMRKWGGSHQFKTGIDYSRILFQASGIGSGPGHGTWTFPKDQPYNPDDQTTWPTQFTNSLPTYYGIPTDNFSLYFQDDFQLPKNITLNMGIRYDVQLGAFNENLDHELSLIADKLGPQFAKYPFTVPFIDTSIRGDHDNFGPRVGLAWDPTGTGRSNIHGAYGLAFDNVRTLLNGAELSWPQAQSIVIQRPSFPDPYQGRSRESFISTAPPNIQVLNNRLVNPYAHQVVVGTTQMITRNMGASIDFSWNNTHDDHQQAIDINMPDPVTRVKPYPQFGRVMFDDPSFSHFYRGLLVKIDKRMSNNYQFLASYTLAKATDRERLSAIGDTEGYSWPLLTHPSVGDRRQRLVLSAIAQLPRAMQVSVIADFRSDLPFQPATGIDLNGDGYAGGANYFTGDNPPGVGYNSGCRDLNLDAINTFRASRGLAAATSVACPGFSNVDFRFSKTLVIPPSHRFEFIVQLFNAFNRKNYADGISNPLSAAFGQVNQLPPNLNAPSRQVELAIRYGF